MKYAVIQTGGKQYKVAEGDVLEVESLGQEKDANMSFDNVLLYTADSDVMIGNPTLTDVIISAKVLDNVRGDKIRVSKFKAKAKYRRTNGHRQHLTRIQIESISLKNEKKATVKADASAAVNKNEVVASESVVKPKAQVKKTSVKAEKKA
jgi:large subunit ribosomal protein L21